MPGASSLSVVATGALVWLISEFVEMVAPTARLSLAAEQVVYLATPWLSLAWLDFALAFTGRTRWRRSWLIGAGVVAAVVTNIVALTASSHGLLWASIEPFTADGFRGHAVEYGPWFWVHALVSWAATATGSLLILRDYAGGLWTLRRLSVWLTVGSLTPLAVNVVFVLGLVSGKSFTTIGFAFGAVVFAASTLRFRFLDLQPTARSILMENLAEGFVALEPSGRVTDFNSAFRRMTGGVIETGDTLTAKIPALEAAFDEPTGEVVFEDAGEARSFEWCTARLGTDTESRGRLIVLRDVTERVVTEMALRTALLELETRNADLDAFAHTVAHDLKNPIHAIRGYAEVLLVEGDDLDAGLRDESLGVIFSMAGKMNDIIGGLLLLAGVRHQTVEPVPVEMGEVLEGALGRLGPFLREHGAVLEVADSWPTALGYGPWLEEVWANYISNAAKYGGDPPHITLGADLEDESVRFWVQDNGAGLEADAQAAVFAPFTRAHDDRADSHGLGLSIVRRILDKLNGSCGVEDAPDGGSRFWFSLPSAEVVLEGEPTGMGTPLRQAKTGPRHSSRPRGRERLGRNRPH